MGKLHLKIHYFDTLDSTQSYLLHGLKEQKFTPPIAVVADTQSAGIGSRGNSWNSQKGNLFLSFSIEKKDLPEDLALASTSIYFSALLKDVLSEHGSKIWLKWPNDFYLRDKKLGGVITSIVGENVVCGIGLNLQSAPVEFVSLDIAITREKLLNEYFQKIEEKISWKQIFSNFKVEFEKSKEHLTHYKSHTIAMSDCQLNDDGSLMYNNERIYSLR